jgi:thymidine kinase
MLTLYFGPMFAGKSTKLMYKIELHERRGQKCAVIKHGIDNRYDANKLVTHRNVVCNSDTFSIDLLEHFNFEEYDVIGVDEGHFFSDILTVRNWVNQGKIVYIALLDSDFRREPMPHVAELVAFSDKVEKIKGVCGLCKTGKSIYSRRIINDSSLILVGGSESYIPVCRNCFTREL